MKGWLIYDAKGAERNKWFINRLTNCCKAVNIDLQLVLCDDGITADVLPELAIVRAIAPDVNKMLEDNGVRVFNNYLTSSVANDKWQTFLLCQELGIPVMSTQDDSSVLNLNNFPYVVKSCDGHGGSEVFMAGDMDEFRRIDVLFRSAGKRYVVQRPCTDLGKDMRLYMLGGKVAASVLRYNPGSFKSNYSLGGSAQAVTPCDYQLQIAEQIYRRLNCDYVGIDFVMDNGKWVVNEIEDAAGARMLYAATNLDIASMLARYVSNVMSKFRR